MLDILVVNINNLKYTRNLIDDLSYQNFPYTLYLVDQNSSEEGTKDFFREMRRHPNIWSIENDGNVDLNRLWNQFVNYTYSPYICMLNNDVRIASNFVEDTITILDKESEVGCVIYATNHPDYYRATDLWYEILPGRCVQGWAFTIKKAAYTMIPDTLKVFGGDDFIFHHLYEKGWKVAVCLSSPIIHYRGKSRRFYTGDREEEARNLRALNCPRMPYRNKYTVLSPTFERIEDANRI